jgi:hypothetical protein
MGLGVRVKPPFGQAFWSERRLLYFFRCTEGYRDEGET